MSPNKDVKNVVSNNRMSQQHSRDVSPFLKWPGGKRWLITELMEIIKGYEYTTYIEPFLGGGSLFFALNPKVAVLSDINTDLVNVYRQVKYHPRALMVELQKIPVNQETYYKIRALNPKVPFEKAVRFLYLNRTAFGGIYRVNSKGEFNVPFGGGDRKTDVLWGSSMLLAASRRLRKVNLFAADFEQMITKARQGSLVYCDPTYTVVHNNNGFIRYNEHNFSWQDQIRLAESCREAAHAGAFVIVSNACNAKVLELYKPSWYKTVSRISRLCPDVSHRRQVDEYIFVITNNTQVIGRLRNNAKNEK